MANLKNRIVVLPCSKYQAGLIDFLKSQNYYLVGINPIETNEARSVDEFIQQDIFDFLDVQLEVDFVLTDQSDVAVIPAIELASILGLPSNSIESANKFSCNKLKMYQHAAKIGVPVLNFQKVTSLDELKIEVPLVFKPSDSTNSRGVYSVHNEDTIQLGFESSLSFTNNSFVIAQEYNRGELQITVEGLCLNRKHQSLAASYKGPYWEDSITSYIRWSLKDLFSDKEIAQLYEQNDFYVNSTQIDNCITHAEYIYCDGTFYLNEIACRGGGFFISSEIAPYVTGINFYATLLSALKGERLERLKPLSRSVILKFYREEIKESTTTGVLKVENAFRKREFVSDKKNPRNSYVIISGRDNAELDGNIEEFENACLY